MPKRQYRSRFNCAEPGCREVETYTHDFRRDEESMRELRRQIPFRCVRHKNPERYMKPGNEATRHVLVATARIEPLPGHKPHLSWVPEDGSSGSSLASGPGFYADANEFPEGSRLVIETHVEMPAVRAEGPAA